MTSVLSRLSCRWVGATGPPYSCWLATSVRREPYSIALFLFAFAHGAEIILLPTFKPRTPTSYCSLAHLRSFFFLARSYCNDFYDHARIRVSLPSLVLSRLRTIPPPFLVSLISFHASEQSYFPSLCITGSSSSEQSYFQSLCLTGSSLLSTSLSDLLSPNYLQLFGSALCRLQSIFIPFPFFRMHGSLHITNYSNTISYYHKT